MSLKCDNHTDIVTEVQCRQCEKPICKKCRISRGTGYLCLECLKEVEKKPTREVGLENRLFGVGAMTLIIGVVFLMWGIFAYLGWTPPTRFDTLGQYETPGFIGFGLLSLVSGILIFLLTSAGRWLQTLLSFAGIGAIMSLHPIAIVAALFHMYFLTVLLNPKTGEIFSEDYGELISDEDLKTGILSFAHALKLPVFILISFIATFLIVVAFVLLFALKPVYYKPTEVEIVEANSGQVIDEIRSTEKTKTELIAGRTYRFNINYKQSGVYPEKLNYQLFVDNRPFRSGKFLPSPREETGEFTVPGRWISTPGKHEVKILISLGKPPQYSAAVFTKTIEVKANSSQ